MQKTSSAVLFRVFSLFAVLCAISVLAVSCAGGVQKRAPSVLTERPERMFWELAGTDIHGKPAKVYVLGTISYADKPVLASVESSVLAAWDDADRLVAEISSADMTALDGAVEQKMMSGAALDKKVTDLRSSLSAAESALLLKIFGPGTTESLSLYEPWVAASLINSALFGVLPYKQTNGLDAALFKKAAQEKRNFSGLDSLETQLELISFGSYNDQLFLLKEKLALFENPQEQADLLALLLERYFAKDRSGYAEILAAQRLKESKRSAVYASHNKRLFDERHKDWAKKIDGFMAEGGTTFVFADASHFAGKQSVFDYMEGAGTLKKSVKPR